MRSAIVRIFAAGPADGGGRQPVGVGFLVDERTALTCAHVVTDALGLARGAAPTPGAVITLDMPLLPAPAEGGGAVVLAAGVETLVAREPAGGGDVAVLRLGAAVPGSRPVRLVDVEGVWGHRAGAFGLPRGRPGGVWHTGVLTAAQAYGWIQMNLDPGAGGYAVTGGFSGGPVWDETQGAVVGMLAAAEAGSPAVSYLIPTDRLAAAWPGLGRLILPPSPYRALTAFQEDDHAIFHGRAAESDRIAQAVAAQRVTTLIGPSGCGKSSLARAGVLPRRRAAGDLPAVMRPSGASSPLHALAAALVPLLEPRLPEIDQLAKTHVLANELAERGLHGVTPRVLARHRANRLLVVIDQFEELLDVPEQDVRAFAETLAGGRPPADVAVFCTLRADFVESVLSGGALRTLVSASFDSLLPMSAEQLREAITAPVEACPGVRFEPGLDRRILADTGASAGLLPLLAFALDRLWRAQDRGVLTFRAYDGLGGVEGALSAYADEAWRAVADDDKPAAEQLLLRLVRMPIGAEAATRRVVPRVELGASQWRVVQRLAAARLVVLNTQADADPQDARAEVESVELAHEVLITAWPVLGRLVTTNAAFLAWRESLRHDVARWDAAQRPTDLLPTRIALEAAGRYLPARERDLAEAEREYLARGRAHHRSRARRRRGFTAGLIALALLASGAATFAGIAAQRARRDDAALRAETAVALSRGLAAQALTLDATDPYTARQLAAAAWRLSPTTEAGQAAATLLTEQAGTLITPDGPIHSAAFNPAGTVLATAGTDGMVRLWNPASQQQIGTTIATTGAYGVDGVAFNPAGTMLATASNDGTVRLWDPATQQQIGTITTTGAYGVGGVAFNPAGTMLATASNDGTVRLWDPATQQQIGTTITVGGGNAVWGVAFNPAGTMLATADGDGTVRLWNPTTQQQIGTTITASAGGGVGVNGVAFNPAGTMLASADGDGTVRLWNPTTQQQIGTTTIIATTSAFGVDDVAFNPAGTELATADGSGTVRLWNPTTQQQIGTITTANFTGVNGVAFNPAGTMLATTGNDGTVRLSNPTTRQQIGTITATTGPYGVNGVAFNPAGTELATADDDGTVRLWNPTTQQQIGTTITASAYGGVGVNGVAFNPAGTMLATAGNDGTVRLWNPATQQQIGTTITASIGPYGVDGVAFNPAGTELATAGNDGTVRLWNPTTQQQIGTTIITGTTGGLGVKGVAFNPAGTMLATADGDGTVRLWNPTNQQQIGTTITITGAYSTDGVAFNPAGTELATADDDGTVRLWNPTTQQQIGTAITTTGGVGVNGLAFNPAGTVLATADGDGTVRLWNPTTRQQIGTTITATTGAYGVNGVAFNPAGTELATADGDGFVKFLNVSWQTDAGPLLCQDFGLPSSAAWSHYVGSSLTEPKTCL